MNNVAPSRLMILAFATLFLFTGCKNVPLTSNVDMAQLDGPKFNVKVRQGNKIKEHVLPLNKNKTVQSLIDEMGLSKKFDSMEIDLIRKVPESQGKHKIPVTFNPKTRRIPVEWDYAILDGDTVLIKQTRETPLADMLDSVMGALPK